MKIKPENSGGPDVETMSTHDIVALAFEKWQALTGVSTEQTRFSMRDWNISNMNREVQECLALDPTGTTSYLILECFLREYLEGKSFTAAQIMKDYAAMTRWLGQAEELFSILQHDRAIEISAQFRARVIAGLKQYNADTPEALAMVEDPDTMAILRRDALRSINALHPQQFLRGQHDDAPPKAVQKIHMAWSINDLLAGMRDMPVSGIAVVLMRDAAHSERSFFTFAMRNGENVFLFHDRKRPAFPGQDEVLAARGNVGRAFAERAFKHHFPYHLVKHSYDDRGRAVFDEETSPAAPDTKLLPLMSIAELKPHQAIWVTMMLSLIVDRFWKQKWAAPELSYTGAMIRNKQSLLTTSSGALVPQAKEYQPITLEDVKLEDVSGPAIDDAFDRKPAGLNAWLEERYKSRINMDLVNIWSKGGEAMPFLLVNDKDKNRRVSDLQKKGEIELLGNDLALMKGDPNSFWAPKGLKLNHFSEADFGTEAELRRDRTYIARYNLAIQVKKYALEEFQDRSEDIKFWFQKAVERNARNLLDLAALTASGDFSSSDLNVNMSSIKEIDSGRTQFRTARLGGRENYGPHRCYLTDAAASWMFRFMPKTAAGLRVLAGEDLPDVLTNWRRDKPYTGNHLLDRLDPMDHVLHDPWTDIHFVTEVYLSRRGLTEARKRTQAAS